MAGHEFTERLVPLVCLQVQQLQGTINALQQDLHHAATQSSAAKDAKLTMEQTVK